MEGRTKTIIALTTSPLRWVLACKHQCMTAIMTVWTESSWAFPESYTTNYIGLGTQAMAGNGKTKGSELYHQSEFLLGVVRTFIGLSYKQ